MKFIRKKISLISLFMTTIMLLIATPYQTLLAAMVPTEATIYQIKAQDARDRLKTLISKNDIKKSLIFQGIDPMEAMMAKLRWISQCRRCFRRFS